MNILIKKYNKKKAFITLFIAVHIFFLVFPIYKQSKFIELSYKKQKYEKQKKELISQKQQLKQQLSSRFDYSAIKDYAINDLKMTKISLKQIKTVSKDFESDIENKA